MRLGGVVKTLDGGVVKTLGGGVTKWRRGKCSTRWGKQTSRDSLQGK